MRDDAIVPSGNPGGAHDRDDCTTPAPDRGDVLQPHIDALFSHGHGIEIVAGGRLDRLFGARRGSVNSVHHQGVDRLGAGLAAEAHAPDGLVEAFHARPVGADILAVQWHPEYDAFANPYGRAFFEAAGRVLRGGALTH